MKQIELVRGGRKSILTIPWTVDELQYSSTQRGTINNESDAFQRVPLAYRALRIRCDSIARVPAYLYRGDSEEPLDIKRDWPYQSTIPFERLIWLSEASLLLKGAAYFVRLLNTGGSELGLQYLNPFTVEQKMRKVEGEMQLTFTQRIPETGQTFPAGGYWTRDEMFYMRQYSPKDDTGPGVPAMAVALQNALLQHYVTQFAVNFFKAGAMPITVLNVPTGTNIAEKERVQGIFTKMIQGIQNAFRVVAVSSEVKPTILTPELKSLDLDKLNEHSVENVSYAFDIPKTVLTADSANYATAETEMKQFIEHTIAPRAAYFQDEINGLLEESGYRIELVPDEMHEMQKDEMQRANGFKLLCDGGMPPASAAEIMGLELPSGFDTWEDLFKQFEESKPKPVAPPPTPGLAPGSESTDGGGMGMDTSKAALTKWQRKAISRFRENGKAQVKFEDESLTPEQNRLVFDALALANSEEAIKAIFRGVNNANR